MLCLKYKILIKDSCNSSSLKNFDNKKLGFRFLKTINDNLNSEIK